MPDTTLPAVIFIIRHGEKPQKGIEGVTEAGVKSIDSLIPRGWQRAGALASLFAPFTRPVRADVAIPQALFSPQYGTSPAHRAYETILPTAQRLGQAIRTHHPVGAEAKAAEAVLASGAASVLVCWEHQHIPDLAAGLPLAPGTVIPQVWPDDRFDLIWRFDLDTTGPRPVYRFSQHPQLLLAGDRHTVAPVSRPGRDGLAA